jgi:hypothetical protein
MTPQIVWRNPEPIRRRQRWELLRQGPDSRMYLVQQFVSMDEIGFWSTTWSLKLVTKQPSSVVDTVKCRVQRRDASKMVGRLRETINL